MNVTSIPASNQGDPKVDMGADPAHASHAIVAAVSDADASALRSAAGGTRSGVVSPTRPPQGNASAGLRRSRGAVAGRRLPAPSFRERGATTSAKCSSAVRLGSSAATQKP